jgi:hypothetical protein
MLLQGETSQPAGGFHAARFVVFFKHMLAHFATSMSEKITTRLPGVL